MAARLYCPLPLQTGAELNLPAQAARQELRTLLTELNLPPVAAAAE